MRPGVKMHGSDRKIYRDIIDFIKKYSNENGYPPTVRDIGEAVGINSSSHIRFHMLNMRRLGLITWEDGRVRTVRVLVDSYDELKKNGKLPQKYNEIIGYINRYNDENGHSPTIEEVRVDCGLRSRRIAAECLNSMRELGLITWVDYRERSIVVIADKVDVPS